MVLTFAKLLAETFSRNSVERAPKTALYMDQTREAVNHSKAAGVPIVVAVNKIDKPDANPDRVKRELGDLGLVPEEWGGETIFANVSAKQKIGLDALLEMILLQAEVLQLKANPAKRARGHVIEARLDKGRGPVATVLIQEGTLHQGDAFVCGVFSGRVRALFDDQGRKIKSAGPAMTATPDLPRSRSPC